MKIFFDKTIEEMAEEGYRPVLGPGGVRGTRITERNRHSLGTMINILLDSHQENHPENPLVYRIEAFVVTVNLKVTTARGETSMGLPPLEGSIGQKEKFDYPVLPYVKINSFQ